MPNRLTDEQFKHVVEYAPLIAIDLVTLSSNKKALLGKRTNEPAKGMWFVPGGRIRKDESLGDAFERIVTTELGIEKSFSSAQLVGAFDHMYDTNLFNDPSFGTHYVTLGYHFMLEEDTDLVMDDQHHAFEWWTLEDLAASEEIHENTKRFYDALGVLSM